MCTIISNHWLFELTGIRIFTDYKKVLPSDTAVVSDERQLIVKWIRRVHMKIGRWSTDVLCSYHYTIFSIQPFSAYYCTYVLIFDGTFAERSCILNCRNTIGIPESCILISFLNSLSYFFSNSAVLFMDWLVTTINIPYYYY